MTHSYLVLAQAPRVIFEKTRCVTEHDTLLLGTLLKHLESYSRRRAVLLNMTLYYLVLAQAPRIIFEKTCCVT